MKKIFVTMLVPLLFVGFSYHICAQTVRFTVTGAGTSAVNGDYYYNSVYNGKTVYTGPGLSGSCVVYWDTDSKWKINDGDVTIYYQNPYNTTHPPESGWEVVSGIGPVPILSGSEADPINITASGAGTPSVNGNYPYVSLLNGKNYYRSISNYRIYWDPTPVGVWKLADVSWNLLYVDSLTTTIPPTGGWVLATGAFPPPTLTGGVDPATPVELTLFTASLKGTTAELRWTTATEVNSYGFDVERRTVQSPVSTDVQSSNWTTIGFVQGSGTSNSLHNYSYVDRNLARGTLAYRLKQIDKDGGFKYLQETEVTVQAPNMFSLAQNYPDPFNPTTTIQFTVPSDGRATLRIFNVLGQEVATLFDGVAAAGEYHQATFDASRLTSGIYFSRLEFDGKMQLKKMVFLK